MRAVLCHGDTVRNDHSTAAMRNGNAQRKPNNIFANTTYAKEMWQNELDRRFGPTRGNVFASPPILDNTSFCTQEEHTQEEMCAATA